MKKTLLTLAAFAAFSAANAQQTYNYFDPADCDADGWLWFDTQEKLDKYCGFTNDFKIVLSGAQYEDSEGQFADCELDAEIQGYNKDGEQGAAGTWTGAIIAPAAGSAGAQNGGGIILRLPDLAEFSVAMSSENPLYQMVLMGSKIDSEDVERIDLGVIRGFMRPFFTLTRDCQYTWSNLQNINNEVTGLTLASPKGERVTAAVFVDITSPVLFQGIKVFTYTNTNEGAAVDGIEADDNAPVEYYNLQGMKVKGDEPGIYVRRQGAKTSKVIVK